MLRDDFDPSSAACVFLYSESRPGQLFASSPQFFVKALVERSERKLVLGAHISQADGFAVVPDPTAELSAWETERGNDSTIDPPTMLFQCLTTQMQNLVTVAARRRETAVPSDPEASAD
jgi:hypothetical protein